MADKRISQLIERVDIANNDVLPIVASGATTTNKVTISTIQDWMQSNLDVGVTSVGLTMPSAFQVSGSPITTSGNISVTATGTASQYIRGDGTLADFPEAGGGGASVSYYLNGSVSQGTIGGIAYLEMNKTPILGAGTDFTISSDGYIASFITDAGDPALLQIPAGNWNFETYLQASSGGGTPTFYIELYKVDSGGTATLIASNSGTPELIAFGTTINPYFSALAVPQTTLLVTDRLALRYYVSPSGRTITLHTENNTLCQIITTFTTGLTALNGLTAQVQNFATGTSGTDFNISSTGSIHTFNLPDASASNRGVVTTGSQVFGGVKTFANGLSLSAVGGSNQVTRIVNIGTLHEGTASVNQIGFNSGNNIYFGKGLNNGGVITWNNAAVRYYTLPNADGTIALTSDLGNYIQGVGTTDSIPKFTAARTLANSAIRDTTSTVIISKNVSVDNGASQAINLTPASSGTTNRIETTGTLPLAIITSGASITLAAGGVTPQITLASTGAVTLTGALNGTSASFTGTVTSTGAKSQFVANGGDSAGAGISLNTTLTTNPTLRRNWGIFTEDQIEGDFAIKCSTSAGGNANTGNRHFFMTSTGAATFSSSVRSNDINAFLLSQTGNTTDTKTWSIQNLSTSGQFRIRALNDSETNGINAIVISRTGISSLSLDFNGAATFSSSVTAGGDILTPTRVATDTINGYTGGSTPLTIQTGGAQEVRIGTNATTRLTISSTGAATFSSSVTANGTFFGKGNVVYQNGSTNVLNVGTDELMYGGTNSDGGVFVYGNNKLHLSTNSVRRLTIDGSGNVGIGTASPTTFSGNTTLSINNAAGGAVLELQSNGTSALRLGCSTSDAALWEPRNVPVLFGTNNTERMRITSGGALLVGNSTATGGFDHAFYNVTNQGSIIFAQTSSASNPCAAAWNNASSGDNLFIRFFINAGGNIAGNIDYLRSSGLVRYNTTSDGNLKNIIGDSDRKKSISILNSTRIREFSWKDDESNKPQIGVIAQELHETFKGAVSVGSEDELLGTEQYKPWGVDKTAFTFHLVAGFQEHERIIKELQEQIDSLKNQMQ